MQLFHTHIQSLPILRTFHFTENQTGTLDSSNTQKEVLPTDPQKTKDLIAGEKRANEWKQVTDTNPMETEDELKRDLGTIFLGEDNTEIAKNGATQADKSIKDVQNTLNSTQGQVTLDAQVKQISEKLNADPKAIEALKKLFSASPEESAELLKANPGLLNLAQDLVKMGIATTKQGIKDGNIPESDAMKKVLEDARVASEYRS